MNDHTTELVVDDWQQFLASSGWLQFCDTISGKHGVKEREELIMKSKIAEGNLSAASYHMGRSEGVALILEMMKTFHHQLKKG